MNIPFVDLQSQYRNLKSEIDKKIIEILDAGHYIGGPDHSDFQKNLSLLLKIDHSILVANGTDAIYACLKMLNIGAGDEVITTAHSWISTSETISQAGAKPIFIDTNEHFCIDSKFIEEKITSNTRAIIPVHLYGHSCDMTEIMSIAKKYNLVVIEDCAQAILTKWRDKEVGSFGSAGTISFFPGKNLGAYGDAGAVVTNDNDLSLKIKKFTNHGSLVKHEHEIEGINSRMDNLQAGILNIKIKYIKEWIELRRSAANYYSHKLKEIDEVSIPSVHKDCFHTYHLYVIRVSAEKRNQLKAFLEEHGISVGIHYPKSLPELDCYKFLELNINDFPNAVTSCQEILSLPIFPEITEKQIDYVVDHIKHFFSSPN